MQIWGRFWKMDLGCSGRSMSTDCVVGLFEDEDCVTYVRDLDLCWAYVVAGNMYL